MTFSVVSQPQDGGCYDSGLEDSETPSSKSSSGPRLGALPLPEEGYERTTPEGSVGEEEHVENGQSQTQTHTTHIVNSQYMYMLNPVRIAVKRVPDKFTYIFCLSRLYVIYIVRGLHMFS